MILMLLALPIKKFHKQESGIFLWASSLPSTLLTPTLPRLQTCTMIWLVIISPSRTAIHAVSSSLPKSLSQELLPLDPSKPTLYQKPASSRYCLCTFMPMPIQQTQSSSTEHMLSRSIDLPSNAAVVLVTTNN